MKIVRVILLSCFAFLSSLVFYSCFNEAKANDVTTTTTVNDNTQLVWHDIESLEMLQSKEPKKVIVDIYTDWCKWCHVMDDKTFTDPDLIGYLNENYYMVKLNAESKKDLKFKGQNFSFKEGGRRGYHTLALALSDDRLSYPSFVILDSSLNKLDITRGYKDATQFTEFLEKKSL